jgi:hypothetical protein
VRHPATVLPLNPTASASANCALVPAHTSTAWQPEKPLMCCAAAASSHACSRRVDQPAGVVSGQIADVRLRLVTVAADPSGGAPEGRDFTNLSV